MIIYSCKSTKDEVTIIDEDVQHINLTKENDAAFISLESVVDSLFVVNLEKSGSSVISHIDKVIVKDSVIYVLDSTFKGIMAYSFKGKYLFSIGGIGSGQDEFADVTDFVIVDKANEILVLANDPGKKGKSRL